MKIIDIAKRIDKSKENEDCIDIYEIGRIFDLSLYYAEQDRLKSYWIGNWRCTDRWVGYKMYFLDDEPVAISIQLGRKCDEEFEWFSKELASKVKDYLITLTAQEEDNLSVGICDVNKDIGDSYKIEFNAEILSHSIPILNGELVEIIERIRETPDYGIGEMLKIKIQNGEEKIVNISELDFRFHLIEGDNK